jgi:hypothetical protein
VGGLFGLDNAKIDERRNAVATDANQKALKKSRNQVSTCGNPETLRQKEVRLEQVLEKKNLEEGANEFLTLQNKVKH